MATEVDQACYGWSHQELSDHDAYQEVPVSQVLDHGSVSFGRFAVETLSWEKKSIFTRNRRQEELEKYRTHGLVAQKKAYFEEYFKRIRAVKSMQENQQSEITEDYGDDASISSQSGEENKTTAELKYHGDQAANVGNDQPEDGPIGVGILHGDLEKLSNGVAMEQTTHPIEALQTSPLSSSTRSFKDNQEENHYDYGDPEKLSNGVAMEQTTHPIEALQTSPLSSSTRSFKDNQEENHYDYALQMQHLNQKLLKDEACIGSQQNIDQHDISCLDEKWVSDGNVNLSYNHKTQIAASGIAAFARRNPKPERSMLKQVENSTRDKNLQNKNTYKKESMPTSKLKISSSAKNNLNLSCKRKSELKPSNGLNPVQGKISKAENTARSKNAAADKLLSKYKSTSDSSCKPLTEGRSKITIPRPFSFATEKRAAASSSLKDDTPRLISNASNRTAPSLSHEKGITIVPSTTGTATIDNGVKGRVLENKRSINLPRGNKTNRCSESENQSYCVARGNRKEEIIKSQISNRSLHTSKSKSNDASLDAKKPRQVMPRWR
ncbi:protein WVD2-like 7 isoform X2 [Musa acuminata AAA Group]|uniref:protein WVD2-like 7 isoform X2 n=1 Tax=Musa acuminata AAA Group TaxID=214697 RepID=UPI0008A0B66B|nr:PREDICTED: protein WVD2-like 7 isoform X2 [Musa acuminata subsp. malaccensis]